MIEQILAARQSRGQTGSAFFFRTHDGWEADLVLESGTFREVIEIKLTPSPTPQDLGRIDKVAGMVRAQRAVLLSRTAKPVFTKSRWSCALNDYLKETTSVGIP